MLSVVVEAAAPTAAKVAARVQDDVDVQVLDEWLCPVRHVLLVQVLSELVLLSVGPAAPLRAERAHDARGLRGWLSKGLRVLRRLRVLRAGLGQWL